jgi:hypothetical protein
MGKVLQILQPYEATLRIAYDDYFKLLYRAKLLPKARLAGDCFIARKVFRAASRKAAAQKIVQWFWKNLKGEVGPAYKVLTVNDPYDEVRYGPKFSCNDPLNNYLDKETTIRVIKLSNGKLIRGNREGSVHHPPNSVKRIRRRRKYNKKIAPRISMSSTGALYYRVTLIPQISGEGIIIQKRKIQNVRLDAREIGDAVDEITERGLDVINEANTLRVFKPVS